MIETPRSHLSRPLRSNTEADQEAQIKDIVERLKQQDCDCNNGFTCMKCEAIAAVEVLRAVIAAFQAPNLGVHADNKGTFTIDFENADDAKRAFDAMEAIERGGTP